MTTTTTTQEQVRVVHVPRGGWRWQNAFRVQAYTIRTTRDGRRIYTLSRILTGKLSAPQLSRLGYGSLPYGSLHNTPAPAEPEP